MEREPEPEPELVAAYKADPAADDAVQLEEGVPPSAALEPGAERAPDGGGSGGGGSSSGGGGGGDSGLPPHTAEWDEEEQDYCRMCPDHADEMLTLVSMVSHTPVCSWCLLDGNHVGEPAENLQLYVETRRAEMQKRLGGLDELMEKMVQRGERLRAQPEQLEEWSSSLRAAVGQQIDGVREVLATQEGRLWQRVRELAKEAQESSEDSTHALDRTLLSLQELASTCSAVIEHPNPHVFVEHAAGPGGLTAQLDELSSSDSVRSVQKGGAISLPAYELCTLDASISAIEGLQLVPQQQGGEASAASPAASGGTGGGLRLITTGDTGSAQQGVDIGSPMPAAASPTTHSYPNQYPSERSGTLTGGGGASPAAGTPVPRVRVGPRVLPVGANYQFPSIGLAIEAASPGDNIIVFEGRYREAITLTKPVEIMGVGVLNDIVVECADERPVVYSWAQYAKVLNLTLQQLHAAGSGLVVDCVKVEGGSFYLDGCNVSSASGSGVVITNETLGEVKRTKLHNCPVNGIRMDQRVEVFVEGCLAIGNLHANVLIADNAVGTLRNNKIIGGETGHGILIENNGKATIENNEVCGHAEPNIEVCGGAEAMSVRNNIHGSKKAGIFAHTRGVYSCENDNVYANNKVGIQVKSGATLLAKNCNVRKNKLQGVWIYEGGQGTLEHNDLRFNEKGGWKLEKDAGRVTAPTKGQLANVLK